ncbi:MAG: MarR family winged helix-turn-helix transcriptional regulator [Paracoccaceae bacterium]
MDSFTLDEFFPYRLAVLSNQISRDFANVYSRQFGISRAEWRVIAHLSQQEKVSIREIHQRVDMDKAKVSRAATRLQTMGLVSKKTNPADKRLLELSLTAKGRRMISKIAPLAQKFEVETLAKLSRTQRQALSAALEILAGKP